MQTRRLIMTTGADLDYTELEDLTKIEDDILT
jgi:hypothetical protein